MKKISIFCLLAGTALLCAVPVSLQFSQDKLSVSLDGASARIGEPLSAGSVAGVHRRAGRRAARGAYYGGYGGYGMAATGAYAGATYNAGSNSYPARATFTQGYMPSGYYGPVCNPSTDRLCQ
jgi:hypothetical protein